MRYFFIKIIFYLRNSEIEKLHTYEKVNLKTWNLCLGF